MPRFGLASEPIGVYIMAMLSNAVSQSKACQPIGLSMLPEGTTTGRDAYLKMRRSAVGTGGYHVHAEVSTKSARRTCSNFDGHT